MPQFPPQTPAPGFPSAVAEPPADGWLPARPASSFPSRGGRPGPAAEFATFTQAISSTRPTIPIINPPASTIWPRLFTPTAASASGVSATLRLALSLGKARLQLRRDGLQRSFRRAHAHAVLQSADHGGSQEPAIVKIVFEEARQHLGVHADRNPNFLRVAKNKRALEAARAHSDHRVRRGVERHHLPNDVRDPTRIYSPTGCSSRPRRCCRPAWCRRPARRNVRGQESVPGPQSSSP